MTQKSDIRVIDASGSHSEVGFKLGSQCKDLANSMMEDTRVRVEDAGLTWEEAVQIAQKHLPYVEEYDPEYVEWIRGYAEGSVLRFEDLLVYFCQDTAKGQCTDIAVNTEVTSDGSVLSAHTEDWYPLDEKHLVLVEGRPEGEPAFLAMTIGGLQIVCGLNSVGISVTQNALIQNDTRIGVPKEFVARKILASRTIGDAMRAAVPEKRGSSYNNNLCDSSGEIYSVEGSATDFDVLYASEGYLVHTNHYLSPKMWRYEGSFQTAHGKSLSGETGSIIRYNRALRLLKKEFGHVTANSLMEIHRDHVNHPNSICQHVDESFPPLKRWKTIFSIIIDLTHLKALICYSNPCLGEYQEYKL